LYRQTGPNTGLGFMHLADASTAFGKYRVNEADPRFDRTLCAEINQALNSPETFDQIRHHFPLMNRKPVTLSPSASGIGLMANRALPGGTNIVLYVGIIIPIDEPENHYSARDLLKKGLNQPIPSDRKCHSTITVRYNDKNDEVSPAIIVGWNTPDALQHFSLDPGCIGGSWANHSCRPNCLLDSVELHVTVRDTEYSIDVPCIKTIDPVEDKVELTVGYGSDICLNSTAYDPKHSKSVEEAGKARSPEAAKRILRGVPLKLDAGVIRAFVARSRLIECACVTCDSNKLLGFYATVLCMDKASGVDQEILLTILGFGVAAKPPAIAEDIDSGVESADSTGTSSDPPVISKRWRSLRPNGHVFYIAGVSRSYRQSILTTKEEMGDRRWYNRQAWLKRTFEKKAMEKRVAGGVGTFADILQASLPK
jgi:hypothetical protein